LKCCFNRVHSAKNIQPSSLLNNATANHHMHTYICAVIVSYKCQYCVEILFPKYAATLAHNLVETSKRIHITEIE